MSVAPERAGSAPRTEHRDLVEHVRVLSDNDPAQCAVQGVLALGVVRDAGDDVAEMHLCAYLGFAYYLLADDARAVEATQRSLDLARALADRPWEAKALATLGSVHTVFGDNTSAIDFLEQALAIRRELGDPFGTAVALNNLGDTYIEMRQFLDRARELLTESHALFTSIPSSPDATKGASVSLGTLAELAMAQSEQVGIGAEAAATAAAEALVRARESLEIALNLDDNLRVLAIARLAEARALVACGCYDEAEQAVRQIRAMGGATSTPYFQIMDSMLTGRIHRARGFHAAAAQAVEAGLALTDDTPRMTERVQLLTDLVAVHEERGAFVDALAAHRRLFEATLRARDEVAERRGRVLNGHLDLERAQLATERAQLRSEQLESVNRTLAYDALHDALTGLANRRDFDSTLAAITSRSFAPLTLVLTDLDNFKAVNDGFSHLVGDEALRRVAQIIGACVRGTDLVARIGGEEVAVLLASDPDPAFAAEVCERIRRSIAEYAWDDVAPGLRITISIGAASWRPGESAVHLHGRADALLYEAKRLGRNRTVRDA
ncbi:MAG: diguanylate cyclase [Cellulomonas sp.]